jgi:hypothetical protein
MLVADNEARHSPGAVVLRLSYSPKSKFTPTQRNRTTNSSILITRSVRAFAFISYFLQNAEDRDLEINRSIVSLFCMDLKHVLVV